MRENMEEKKFNIGFFEFCFLVEACIPPKPIARTAFWHEVIDHYYHIMTRDERSRLLDWIVKNPYFDTENDDIAMFYDRYNEINQYIVTTVVDGVKEEFHCFLHFDRYCTGLNKFINSKYITNVKRKY